MYSVNVLIDKDDKETPNESHKGYQEAVQDGVERLRRFFQNSYTAKKESLEATRSCIG